MRWFWRALSWLRFIQRKLIINVYLLLILILLMFVLIVISVLILFIKL